MDRMRSWPGALLWSGLLLFVCVHCQAWHQLMRPVRMDGKPPEFLEYGSVFKVYYDKQVPEGSLYATLQSGLREYKKLRRNFFPESQSSIEIVVYRDRASYHKHAGGFMRQSLARYNQKTNRLSLVVAAPRVAWRHELVHALLSEHRHGSFRIQEGMAYFLQNQSFDASPNCTTRTKARVPNPAFASLLNQLREKPLPDLDRFYHLSNRDSRMQPEFLALSTYYMYYLFQQGLFQKSLQHYLTYPGSSLEFLITRGNRLELAKHHQAFGRWLRSDAPTRSMPGC